MKIKPIVLLGKTASGKDATRASLKKYGFKPIVTTTTRAARKNEVEGVSYSFVSEPTFKELVSDGYFAEFKMYKIFGGKIVYYGSPKHLYKPNTCVILTPSGLQDIKKAGIDCYSVYLDVDEESIIKKQVERGDEQNEAARRLSADRKDFEGIEKEVDFVIDNHGYKLSPDQVAKEILARVFSAESEKKPDVRKPEFAKRIYISHKYGNNFKNLIRVEAIISQLQRKMPENNYVSPLHCFGFMYNTVDYQTGLDMCLNELDTCDEMWVFDDFLDSKGVNAEIEYCKKYGKKYKIWSHEELNKLGVD